MVLDNLWISQFSIIKTLELKHVMVIRFHNNLVEYLFHIGHSANRVNYINIKQYEVGIGAIVVIYLACHAHFNALFVRIVLHSKHRICTCPVSLE